MRGYLRSTIKWILNNQRQFPVKTIAGNNTAISTLGTPTTSFISVLTINALPFYNHSYTYTCLIPGTSIHQSITVRRVNVSMSVSITTPKVAVYYTSSSSTYITSTIIPNSSIEITSVSTTPTSAVDEETSPTVIIPFVVSVSIVSLVLLSSSAVIFTIAAIYAFKRSHRSEVVSPTKAPPIMSHEKGCHSMELFSNTAYTPNSIGTSTVIEFEESIYAEIDDFSDDYI